MWTEPQKKMHKQINVVKNAVLHKIYLLPKQSVQVVETKGDRTRGKLQLMIVYAVCNVLC